MVESTRVALSLHCNQRHYTKIVWAREDDLPTHWNESKSINFENVTALCRLCALLQTKCLIIGVNGITQKNNFTNRCRNNRRFAVGVSSRVTFRSSWIYVSSYGLKIPHDKRRFYTANLRENVNYKVIFVLIIWLFAYILLLV